MKQTIATGLFLALSCQAVLAVDFMNKDNLIGCGEITSVRKVNQAPLYDKEYDLLHGNVGGTSGIAGMLTAGGVVKFAAAAVTSMVADKVIADNTTPEAAVKAQDSWDNVLAVRIAMDNGSVLNLPLTAPPADQERRAYTQGKRVRVFYVPELNSVQVSTLIAKLPGLEEKETKRYQSFCGGKLDESTVAKVLNEKGNLVIEQQIVQ